MTTSRFVIVESRQADTNGRFPVTVNDGHGAWTERWTPARILDYARKGYDVTERNPR